MILMGSRCYRGHGNGRYRNNTCVTCHATREKARPRRKELDHRYALWDGEYQFLREQGLTPREIGEKHGVRWASFQRTLWRRVGAKPLW